LGLAWNWIRNYSKTIPSMLSSFEHRVKSHLRRLPAQIDSHFRVFPWRTGNDCNQRRVCSALAAVNTRQIIIPSFSFPWLALTESAAAATATAASPIAPVNYSPRAQHCVLCEWNSLFARWISNSTQVCAPRIGQVDLRSLYLFVAFHLI
jgi:hypothetical protein